MKIRHLLPFLLTAVAILAAAVLPAHVARMGDRTLTGQIHTEPFDAEQILVEYRDPTLLDRLTLCARWQEDGAVTAFYQSMPEDTDMEELTARVQEALSELTRNMPTLQGRIPETLPKIEVHRILLRDSVTGLTARLLQVQQSADKVYSNVQTGEKYQIHLVILQLWLDEETDRILGLDATNSTYSTGSSEEDLSTEGYTDLMLQYLNYLGLRDTAVEELDSVSSIGCFFTLDNGVIFRLDLRGRTCVMTPTGTVSVSHAGDRS